MKFSVVTVSFNQAKYLRQCIDSVLNQTGIEIEYIVVDPGSTDGSRAIIESYGTQIIPIFEPDDGPADGLNKGFAIATGEIFGFINADDYLLPGALGLIGAWFGKHGMNEFVTGSGYIEYSTGIRRRVFPSVLSLRRYIYGACNVFQQGTFFPASMLRKVGGFETQNRTCWDGELFALFLAAGFEHHTIPDELAVFRIYEESITGSGRLLTDYRADHDRIFRQHLGRQRNLVDMALSFLMRANKFLQCKYNEILAKRLL